MDTFITMDANNITNQDRMEALSSLIVLVKKKDSIIKVRSCADGIKHIIYMNKYDAYSPKFA